MSKMPEQVNLLLYGVRSFLEECKEEDKDIDWMIRNIKHLENGEELGLTAKEMKVFRPLVIMGAAEFETDIDDFINTCQGTTMDIIKTLERRNDGKKPN